MRITADSIDYNTVKLINDNMDPWSLSADTDAVDNERLIILGYIQGVIDMASAMKEVLKA